MQPSDQIDLLREGEPWEVAERAHCLHCRADAPQGQERVSLVVLITRKGIYSRSQIKCKCGRNAFCLPILNEGEETQEAGPAPGAA